MKTLRRVAALPFAIVALALLLVGYGITWLALHLTDAAETVRGYRL